MKISINLSLQMGFVPTADKVGQHQVEEKIRVGNLNHIARHVVI